jgi:hypothetical protein
VAAPGFSTFGDPTKYHNFFHSLNGGTTWESVNIRNSSDEATTLNYLYATYFLNDSVGWVVGTNSLASPTGKIFMTTDEAVTWQDVSPAGADNVYFYDVYFSSATTGWAVGGDTTTGIGYIYSSTDGGLTWGTFGWPIRVMFSIIAGGTGRRMPDCWIWARAFFTVFILLTPGTVG